MSEKIVAYADLTDWDHEFNSGYPLKLFQDVDDLREDSPCVHQCGIAKVTVEKIGIEQESDYTHKE